MWSSGFIGYLQSRLDTHAHLHRAQTLLDYKNLAYTATLSLFESIFETVSWVLHLAGLGNIRQVEARLMCSEREIGTSYRLT